MADQTKFERQNGRYKADITAGSLKLLESKRIADLLLQGVDAQGWNEAIVTQNILQIKSPATAKRMASMIRARLAGMGPELWKLVRDGNGSVVAQAVFAAAVKHSPLLGDFVGGVVKEHYRTFEKALSHRAFDNYLDACRSRDQDMPEWNEATRLRLRSSIFQMLAQAGYIENTSSLKLMSVHLSERLLSYLKENHEEYVLKSM